jgi:pimeloyl-ACP methyl ester carboxylesterase
MTYVITFTLPPTGEVQDQARLVSWLVQPDQKFKCNDVLLEIETDKSVVEIVAPQDGKMLKKLVNVGDLITLETPLASLELEGEALEDEWVESDHVAMIENITSQVLIPKLPQANTMSAVSNDQNIVTSMGNGRRFATPAARDVIDKKNIDMAHIQGTGPNGRITLTDVKSVTSSNKTEKKTRSSHHVDMIKTQFGSLKVKTWEPIGASLNTPDIVLIHGMFADTDSWASLALSLSRLGQRVISIDLPSHGGSDATVESFAHLVDSVQEALFSHSVARHILVGHSLGGAVAARLARQPNVSAQALILISPLGLGTEIEQNFLHGTLNAKSNEAMGRELAKLTYAKSVPSDLFIEALRDRIRINYDGLEKMSEAVSCHGVQQISIATDLQKVICPVSLLHGLADGIISWRHSLNAPSHVALHLIPEVGHMPHWEASTLTTEIILRHSKLATLL